MSFAFSPPGIGKFTSSLSPGENMTFWVCSVVPPPSTGLTMEIAPRGACWVSVTVDGEPSFSALLNAGEKRQLSAKEEVLVTVGDAGAFVYTLNGSPGKPLGAPGEVVSKRINLTNYRDLLNR